MFREEVQLHHNILLSREERPILVAEIGLNHNNDLEIGKRTIESAAKAGAQAVKFQTYRTSEFIDPKNNDAKFLFDIFLEYELTEKSHRVFQQTAKDNGVLFFSTPLCVSAVDLLVSLNVPCIKIASGDVVNSELLTKVSQTKLPLLVSTGAADLSEVIRALEFLKDQDVQDLVLMHCVSLYPTPKEAVNLKTLELFKEITDGPVGFSDHSSGHLAGALAVGMDASVVEKHFTLDKTLPGPDHTISASPEELKNLSDAMRIAYEMKGTKKKTAHTSEVEGRFYGRRSLYPHETLGWISLRPAMHLKDSIHEPAWAWLDKQERT